MNHSQFLDNLKLNTANKVISLSKLDTYNLKKFIETLQSNNVKIIQPDKNLLTRKRIMLLGNSKLRRCYACSAKFSSEFLLEEHLKNEHQITKEYLGKPIRHVAGSTEKPLTCKACGQSFLSDFNLKSHLKWCISFPCPHCEDHKTFACDFLVKHTREAHGDEYPFKCCKCKEEFNEYRMYVRHSCAGNVCEKCGKKFSSIAGLTFHIHRHKTVPCNIPFRICAVCQKMLVFSI